MFLAHFIVVTPYFALTSCTTYWPVAWLIGTPNCFITGPLLNALLGHSLDHWLLQSLVQIMQNILTNTESCLVLHSCQLPQQQSSIYLWNKYLTIFLRGFYCTIHWKYLYFKNTYIYCLLPKHKLSWMQHVQLCNINKL